MLEDRKLRIVHVAEDLSAVAGGIPAVVRQLSRHLTATGIEVEIAHATGDPKNVPGNVKVSTFPPNRLGRVWSWQPGLRRGLSELIIERPGQQSVVHVHGIWSGPQFLAGLSASSKRIPFVLSSHGMLEPWLWNEQGWLVKFKKRRYWALFAYPALSKASVVHAITPLERDHLSELFPHNRIEIIPNAIDLSKYNEISGAERSLIILFLGRIEPKKGVDLLLHAFAQARIDSQWTLEVVGPVWSDGYQKHLQSIVSSNGLTRRVNFRGPLFGAEKHRLIDRAWVMAVPSHSEVVGLVNLEAAASYLPSITTYQTGLYDWERGGGLLIEPDIEKLRRALEIACSWSPQEQVERGRASRRLIEDRYSWESVLPLWVELYSSLCA